MGQCASSKPTQKIKTNEPELIESVSTQKNACRMQVFLDKCREQAEQKGDQISKEIMSSQMQENILERKGQQDKVQRLDLIEIKQQKIQQKEGEWPQQKNTQLVSQQTLQQMGSSLSLRQLAAVSNINTLMAKRSPLSDKYNKVSKALGADAGKEGGNAKVQGQ